MKIRNQVKKFGTKAAVVGTTLAVSATQALAAVPAEATTEGQAVKADIVEIGAYGLIASLVVMAFAYMRRSSK